MRRMAVFVLYDFENMVDDYVWYLLKTLPEITEEILVVSNSKLRDSDREKLLSYGIHIIERRNYGYDGGAYKDAFLNYLKQEELTQWDEIILLNDTFYGPFFPWKNVFDTMEGQKLDFWGLTKLEKGIWNKEEKIPCHIQAYFLVIRKNLFETSDFIKFWETLDYPETLDDAVKNYEIRFTTFFSDRGFKYAVFTDFQENGYLINKTANTYEYYMYELISQSKVPILKRKPLSLANYSKVVKTLKFIEQNTNYDVNLIKSHLERMEQKGKIIPYSKRDVDFFCEKYADIYIYGYGEYGKEMKRYLDDNHIKIKGIIVSEIRDKNTNALIAFKDLVITKTMGIILALGKNNVEEVYSVVSLSVPDQQLLIPKYEKFGK